MAKTIMICPFTHKLCNECAIYRGRHYYLNLCRQNHGYINDSGDNIDSGNLNLTIDFQAFMQLIKPCTGKYDPKIESGVELEVIDMDGGEKRTVTLEEIKDWDWDDSKTVRIIDGRQITSLEELVQLVSYKINKGDRELKLYEAPPFILLAGG